MLLGWMLIYKCLLGTFCLEQQQAMLWHVSGLLRLQSKGLFHVAMT